jgi:hypothetical protein
VTENAEIFLRLKEPIIYLIDTRGTNDTYNSNNG